MIKETRGVMEGHLFTFRKVFIGNCVCYLSEIASSNGIFVWLIDMGVLMSWRLNLECFVGCSVFSFG